MTPPYVLYRLQQGDSAVADLERQLAGLDDGVELRRTLDEREQELAARRSRLATLQRETKKMEQEDQTLSRKVQELTDKLSGGKVSNPKEATGFAKDIEQYGRMRDQLEEQLLQKMEEAEALQAEVEGFEKEVAGERATGQERLGGLAGRRTELEESLAKARKRREHLAKDVEEDDLVRYERLRGAKAGLAVAKVDGGRCGGCRTTIPDSLFRKVLAARTLETCGTCGRILYAETRAV